MEEEMCLVYSSTTNTILRKLNIFICGPIQPLCGPFRYFMVLIDASTRWLHVCLLSTCNLDFAKFMAQVIRLKENFYEHRIQSIRLDNIVEFEYLIIIVWLKEFKCNIQYHIYIPKMVWLNLS
jgi:hypothetical protein